ncbi:metal dependent phosphohydrolase [Tolypothrix tenuis PCC 7101]|uniref:Metal dependent phosphohydrolase n=1 Tax=Tolypothrix tenuis PCC 7101 TaxID=231146 RepID=A0A1Z4N884_9CYAN|nr:HD family phosphohydrolase [Aulosira sp. FACHB-113]BAZ01936.1 metal dependent phosphohydrolase [Tolypothrix tenuis PCC 7101]BAZ74139.1 metal dependent phosphohydrolase [Aulosira laxa NIES-50]
MKHQRFLKSLTQQFTQWRRQYKVLRRKGKLLRSVSDPNSQSRLGKIPKTLLKNIRLYVSTTSDGIQKPVIALRLITKSVQEHRLVNNIGVKWVHENRSSVILAIAIVSLTGVIGYKSYYQPKLKVDSVAPETIKAPRTDKIEDIEKTKAQRKAAVNISLPMLRVDQELTEQINHNLQQILDQGDEIRYAAGDFPFAETLQLSLTSQSYLRACSESEWKNILLALEKTKKQPVGFLLPNQNSSSTTTQEAKKTNGTNQLQSTSPQAGSPKQEELAQPGKTFISLSPEYTKPVNVSSNADLFKAITELEIFRVTNSAQKYSLLISQISQARKKYQLAKEKLLRIEAGSSKIIYQDNILLELSDQDWIATQTLIRDISARILAQGIPYGLPEDALKNTVNLQVEKSEPPAAQPLVTKVLLTVLQPNLKKDETKTKQQAQRVADDVAPIMVEVRKDEVIVKKGEKITPWNLQVLEHYQLIDRETNWAELIKVTGIVTTAIGIFVIVERRLKIKLRQRDRLLILLLTLSTPGMLTFGVSYTTWSAIGLLLGSFYGPSLGVTVVGLLLGVLPIGMEMSRIVLVSGAAGGIVGSLMAKRLRSREELALLGLAIASTQGGIYLILLILRSSVSWYVVLQGAGLFALSGLAWSIVALGLSPYLEKLFDLVTPIRLAELANPNRPLLKRLATEAPGTFQHTLFVATLAEAAAKHLKCDVELVRAGTLYHDIGKMHDPSGFIENQMGGPNKHETEIKDPWKSAAIIKKHVSEGLAMAQEHLLPTAIQAFIPEHQGTMLIAYFHHQAQQMAKENPSIQVDDADFRYDGPIPQSRETAIVMLADSCEAALRSLKDATPEQALNMLNNILRARWQDNQLVDCGLTREEVSDIAQIFVEVWQQFHHKRIAYPKFKTNSEKVAKG